MHVYMYGLGMQCYTFVLNLRHMVIIHTGWSREVHAASLRQQAHLLRLQEAHGRRAEDQVLERCARKRARRH